MTLRPRRAAFQFLAATALAAGLHFGPAWAETVGPVTDDVGVVRIPKGQPILIGALLVLSGPDISLGLDASRGAEIAFDDHKNMLVGHSIKYLPEDGQCSVEGGADGRHADRGEQADRGGAGHGVLVRIAGRRADIVERGDAAGGDQRDSAGADGGGPPGRAAGDRAVRLQRPERGGGRGEVCQGAGHQVGGHPA